MYALVGSDRNVGNVDDDRVGPLHLTGCMTGTSITSGGGSGGGV